jgi:hypothetical protein
MSLSAIMAVLSELESLAATILIQVGMLNRRIEQSKLVDGAIGQDEQARQLRLSLFESAQNLLAKVTPPEFALTQGLSASVRLSFRRPTHADRGRSWISLRCGI